MSCELLCVSCNVWCMSWLGWLLHILSNICWLFNEPFPQCELSSSPPCLPQSEVFWTLAFDRNDGTVIATIGHWGDGEAQPLALPLCHGPASQPASHSRSHSSAKQRKHGAITDIKQMHFQPHQHQSYSSSVHRILTKNTMLYTRDEVARLAMSEGNLLRLSSRLQGNKSVQ